MLRHLGPIAVCACIVASVGCNGSVPTAPPPPTSPPPATVTVQFGGRVVNADAGGPVENVKLRVEELWIPGGGGRLETYAKDTATSGGDGLFTLPLNLPSGWRRIYFHLTAPPGYDDRYQWFDPTTAADRPAIGMYPTLVIRPGESIDVRVDGDIVWCGMGGGVGGVPCRRVLVTASPGDPVELEVVPHDSSQRMALGLAIPGTCCVPGPHPLQEEFEEYIDPSMRRIMVPPGGVLYVVSDFGGGTARLTARR